MKIQEGIALWTGVEGSESIQKDNALRDMGWTMVVESTMGMGSRGLPLV